MIIARQRRAPELPGRLPFGRSGCRVDRDPVLRQQIAQLVILVADRRRGQGVDQSIVDATKLDALIDELLPLVDLALNRAIILDHDDIDDHQNQGDPR